MLNTAVIIGGHRKKIRMDNGTLMQVAPVIGLINRMKMQSWEIKRRQQQNWQKCSPQVIRSQRRHSRKTYDVIREKSNSRVDE
jgi:hypothetical protein